MNNKYKIMQNIFFFQKSKNYTPLECVSQDNTISVLKIPHFISGVAVSL